MDERIEHTDIFNLTVRLPQGTIDKEKAIRFTRSIGKLVENGNEP